MLDVTARGILEKAIDEVKGVIPELVRDKDTFGTQTSQSYFMGFARRYIYGKFSTLFLLTNGRLPNYGETKEMDEVMNNRLAELRGAVSKAGAEPES